VVESFFSEGENFDVGEPKSIILFYETLFLYTKSPKKYPNKIKPI